ncbi:SRPBCC family protein [Nocardia sp. MW-W600-9]
MWTTGLANFDLAVVIRRSPAAVFAFLADIQDFEPIPRRATVRLVKEPVGPTTPGTRWHEWVTVARGCRLHIENAVSEVWEPHRLRIEFHSAWFAGHLTYDLEPTAEGTILHHRETLRPRTLLRWLTPWIERRLRPHLVERLADIKTILEESATGAAH